MALPGLLSYCYGMVHLQWKNSEKGMCILLCVYKLFELEEHTHWYHAHTLSSACKCLMGTVFFLCRYAIVVAAERCQIEILDLFLLKISQNQPDDEIQSVSKALPPALVCLANCGFVDMVEKLLGMFNTSSSLWSSHSGPRLLYVLLSLKAEHYLPVVVELVKDVASFLCQALLVQQELDVPGHTEAVVKLLKQLQVYLPFFCRTDHSCIHLFVRFVKFCCNFPNYYDRELMFHCLCGTGEYNLVAFVLDTLSDAHVPYVLSKLDSDQRSPLFYAACGGHSRVVDLLVNKGSSICSEEQDPPIKGLLMYLVQSPFTNCLGELFMTSRWTTHAIRVKSYKRLNRVLPYFCAFDSELFSNQLDITQLVSLLLPTPDQLECVLNKHLFQIITMLCTIRNLNPFTELLLGILRITQKSTSVFNIPVEDEKELCSFESVFNVPPDTKSPRVSITDVAMCLVPYSASSSPEVTELHDSILVCCADSRPLLLETLSIAAEKGYWGLVMNALPNVIGKQNYPTMFLQKHLSIIWYQAVIAEQRAVFDAFYAHVSNVSTLITAAIKHSKFHMVELFLNDPDGLYTALSAAIQYDSMHTFTALLDEVMTLESHKLTVVLNALVVQSVRYANTVSLKSLLTLYQDSGLNNNTEFPDKTLSFWFLVLCQSAKFGNEKFGLQSVSYISELQMESIVEHDRYLDVLNGCCYWGMADLLQHLPVTSEQLFERPSREVACPWENAVANCHLGKLSFLPVFPTLPSAITQLPQDSPLMITSSYDNESRRPASFGTRSLFCGVFNKVLSVQSELPDSSGVSKDTFCQKQYQWFQIDYVGILLNAIIHGLTRVVKVFMEHLGKYAGEVIDLLEIMSESKACTSLLFAACCKDAIKDNDAVLNLLLKPLYNSHLLIKHLNKVSHGDSESLFQECLTSTVQRGSIKCAELLLLCTSSPQPLSFDFKQSYQNGDTLLHLAVYSKSAEMVDLVLGLLKEDAVDSCFVMNNYKQCPLYLALALGCTDIIHNSRLVKESCKSVKFRELESYWYPEAYLAHGWFHAMMLSNSAYNSNGSHANVQSSTCALTPRHTGVDIRMCNDVWELLILATKYQEHALVKRLLLVSPCAMLLRSSELPLFLLQSAPVLKMMKSIKTDCEPLMPVLMKIVNQLNTTMNHEDDLLQALELIQYEDHHVSFIKATFHSACALRKMTVVKYLLQRSDEVVVIQLALFQDNDTLKKGLAQAIAHGCFDIAAYLQLEYDLPFESPPAYVHLSDLTHEIFSCKTYYQLLESFFNSTTKSASASKLRTFPLAAAWLAHNWTEEEAMLIMKKVGGTSGTNPWKINVTSNPSGPTELSLHVDWDSFSECLLHSPHVDFPTSKYRYTPLLAEATVFSPVILGEILQCLHMTDIQSKPFSAKPISFDLFALTGDSNLSSVILSCDTWPAKPLFMSMNRGEQGVLSLSYKPSEGVFVFPDTTVTKFNTSDLDSTASGIDDSGIHFSFENSSTVNDLHNDISRHYSVQIRKNFRNKVKVRVQLSENLLDSAMFNSLQSHLLLCLDDCISVLKLVQKPALRYSHAIPQLHLIGVEAAELSGVKFELLFNKICVYLNVTEHQSVSATCDGDILNIIINIACDSDSQDVSYPAFETLLQNITTCILVTEVEKDKENFKNEVALKVLSKLKKSLKFGGSLEQDLLSLTVRDHSGNIHKMDTLTTEHLVYIKSLIKLKNFLSLFFKTLHVLSFKPRLQTSVRNRFEAGFKVFLTFSDDMSYSVKAGVPHLTISCQSLLNGSYCDSLLDVLGSLVESASYQRQSVSLKDFASQVPAPSLCHVDIKKSKGLLYPMVKTKGTLLIQLVDYSKQKISTRPTIICVVEVTLISPTSKKVHLTYRDDECIVASTSDKQVIVHFTSSGEIQIDWTPQEAGFYRMFISLNSIPIKGSPFKSWCVGSKLTKKTCIGTRKSTAGFPLTFIVEHNHLKPQCNYHCTCDPLVHLHKRAPIKPFCMAALEPYGEGELFGNMSANRAGQFLTSSSSRASPSKRLNDKLMQAERSSGVHHISIGSNFERPVKCFGRTTCNWFQIPAQHVTVHIHVSPDDSYNLTRTRDSFNVQCNPLNNGMYSIILKNTKACMFKMFVSCPICQSVMKIHWVDQMTLLPSICYVLPGIISPKRSTLKYTFPYVHGEL